MTQNGKVGVKLTATLVDLETGELLGKSEASAELPGADDVDITTRTGILAGVDEYENAMLGARDVLMNATTENYTTYLEKKNGR